tara:strand:+ start:887 stop:2137 length:1251 start_codon:yes stop_codon:yes gene_type:complete
MKDFTNKNTLGKFSFLLLSISLFVGFYFNETASGIGAKADFYNYWPYVLDLKDNFYSPGIKYGTMHLPLHFMILARLSSVFSDTYFLRLFFCFLSISVPYLFYLNLKTKFNTIDENKLWFLASLTFIFPSFRYSAIWANGHITGLIFFLLSTLFFLKWIEKKNFTTLSLDLILQVFFLSIAVYTRQYYALFFLYLMLVYFQKLKLDIFIKLSFVILILSLPGFWIIYSNPSTLRLTFSTEIPTSLLINSSIMAFYLIPIFICLFINNKKIFSGKMKQLFILTLFSILFVFFLSLFFDYNFKIGGGFFLKLSIIIFENNLLFYLTSIIGFIFLSYLSVENNNNFILIIILLIGFSAYMIFQKYFEPLFFFMFFLIFNSKLTSEFLINYKNLFYLYIYVFFYFTSAIINDFLNITVNL